jgi:hypothetical protein
MFANRSIGRTAFVRTARQMRTSRIQQLRFQSSSTSQGGGGSSHLVAGVAGGVIASAVLYGAYYVSPTGRMARTINKTAKEANNKYQVAAQKLQESTPDADQAIDYIKNFCYSYVAWVPGGRKYVDAAFEDVETVRKNHRDEANELINDAYRQFQELSKSGLSLETASKAADVLADLSKKIGRLAGDSFSDVLDNHPQLKEKFGGSIDQLKQMGEQYGPEAQKQVEQTWNQIRDVMAGGLSAANIDKARKLIEEKVEQVKKLGDEAWTKGMEQAKPYLDKNPKVKELVEKNADALKQGNAKQLFEQAKKAVDSNDLGGLEDYVKNAVEKAKSKGSKMTGGLSEYFDSIPDGADILSKVQQLKDVADKHKEEGQQLLKETMEELKQVLEKKSDKAKDIAEKAREEAK